MTKSAARLAVLALLATAGMVPAPQAEAAKAPTPVRYANCKALNKAYRYGVRAEASTKNKVVSKGRTLKPSQATVNQKAYQLNAKELDADRDGIACEH
ncbi:hypothetical protein GCM10027030_26770 [Luteococcus sediminum]